MLQEASDYAHKIILTSGTLVSTPQEDIAFNDVSVSNMRGNIFTYAKKFAPELYDDMIPDSLSFTDPAILEITKRNILADQTGNCGEFLTLALTYLLEQYKDQLANLSFKIVSAGHPGHLNHVYLHIEDHKNNKIYFYDPTCRQVSLRENQTGNIYIRGKKGKPNQYVPFTVDNKDYIEHTIATIDPVKIHYPLTDEMMSKIDKLFVLNRHDL